MGMGMGMKAGTGTGNGTEFKPDSRALPDAADFDLYLIVCKQRAEYPTVCMEYGWMVRQTHTKRDPQTDSLNIYRIHMYTYVVYAQSHMRVICSIFGMKLIDYFKSNKFRFLGVDDDDDEEAVRLKSLQ